MRRRDFVVLAIAALAIGAFVVVYHGPGRAVLRGHVGDVAATMLVYALLGLAWRARIAVRATVTLAIAVAIECVQTLVHLRSAAASFVVGTTFDPWDLVAYVAGVALAIAWERYVSSRAGTARLHASHTKP
ncbi:MAG TPA: DUF2809 domain-containing protein [Kofleriaceae bacterium]|nr:DUF2809 domain-containing protein [Kofleriaceae bacterium]